MDISAKYGYPKGRDYCDKPGTSCYYGPDDVCVNCGRKKGWRKNMLERPKVKLSFRYSYFRGGDIKLRVRIFADLLHVGCLWCTVIKEDREHLSISFIGPDDKCIAIFYFLDYELIEDY